MRPFSVVSGVGGVNLVAASLFSVSSFFSATKNQDFLGFPGSKKSFEWSMKPTCRLIL